MRPLCRLAMLAFLLLGATSCAVADSPSADETPFWPVSVTWYPQLPVATCSASDAAKPHGAATWDAQFTGCAATLAYFDTCADDTCVVAFTASAKQALNCSFDGKAGTAQEVEANRLLRCMAARQVAAKRYVPGATPSAPLCSATQQDKWNAAYGNAPAYSACLQVLTSRGATGSCSDDCQRLFHDGVNDAEECLVSAQSGGLTQHEWLKYTLVWCATVRGESLKDDPVLQLRGTPSPSPTTPKPTKTTTLKPTTAPPVSASSSSSSSGSEAGLSSKSMDGSLSQSMPMDASTDRETSSGPAIDIASSFSGATAPIVSPPAPGAPQYGMPTSEAAQHLMTVARSAAVAGGLLQVLYLF